MNRLVAAFRRGAELLSTPSGIAFGLSLVAGSLSAIGAVPAVIGAVGILVGGMVVMTKFGFVIERMEGAKRRNEELTSALDASDDERRASLHRADDAISELTDLAGRLHRRIEDLEARHEQRERRDVQTREQQETDRRRTDEAFEEARQARALVRYVGASLRAEIVGSVSDLVLPVVEVIGVPQPLLSIAIPGYNRPHDLRECLDSFIAQIDPGTAEVELVVNDDASTDRRAAELAHEAATTHSFIGYSANATNLGLERNLIESARRCRGEYLWIFGNDDKLAEGGLATVLADVRSGPGDVLLYDKSRIGKNGEPAPPRPGSVPTYELAPGEAVTYSSPFDVGTRSGLNSSFGWISQVVLRRSPFLAVDPNPFFDLTMYPQLAMLLVAFSRSPVRYRNAPVVIHRTLTDNERLADVIGREEESFMAAGLERRNRWFGVTYAAMLQRVTDVSEVEATDFEGQVERLWSKVELLDWVAWNWKVAIENGIVHDPETLADAVRLFESLGRPIPG